MQKIFSLLFGVLMLPQLAMAVGVHQHGVAQLDVVLEPPMLTLALHSPLANFIGFEYKPVSAEEQARWTELQEQMLQARLQVELPTSAGCSLDKVVLSDPFVEYFDDHDHSELTVEYQYNCTQPQQLKQVQLPLLQNYPGIEKLEVRMLSPAGQHLQSLGGQEHRLTLP